MYLHLGSNTVVSSKEIIGIFDLDSTTVSKHTRDFLKTAEQKGEVVTVSYELPKSFLLAGKRNHQRIFLSQLASSTLYKRSDFTTIIN
ncbi:MAG: DUF370 domain-containing protein [Clostridia bacterium]|nr:DUF370 domain-containing protein [Clostridia bacterium]